VDEPRGRSIESPRPIRQRLILVAGLWIAGLVLGLLVFAAGALLHSNLLAKVGFALVAIGLSGSLLARIIVFRAAGPIRWYGMLSLCLRAAAILVILYLAISFHG
jgi:hypothetical protein